MTGADLPGWLGVALLGAFHGVNPGMGWLFAVALGLQEGRRRAVWEALVPIAMGHAASVALVVGGVALSGVVAPPDLVRVVSGLGLVAFGLYRVARPLHRARGMGMRVRGADLCAWSFLMATGHGAGLMLVPLLLPRPGAGVPAVAAGAVPHPQPHPPVTPGGLEGWAVVAVHTGATFLTMAGVAALVYERLGVALLRKAWFNLDLLWAAALVLGGLATLVA